MKREFSIGSSASLADAVKKAKVIEAIPNLEKQKDGSIKQNRQERLLFVVKDKPTGVKLLKSIQTKLERPEDSVLLEGMKKLSLGGYHTVKFMEEKSFDGLLTNYDNGFKGKLSLVTQAVRVKL